MLAHDPVKRQRFAGNVMRQFVKLERDLAQNRSPLVRPAFQRMIPKSGCRFSERIMRKSKA